MLGKQAKILSDKQARSIVRYLKNETRYGTRNHVIFLLSFRAGMRAGEISKLTWDMVLDAGGLIQDHLEIRNCIAKQSSGRVVPTHPELASALHDLLAAIDTNFFDRKTTVIRTMRNGPMSAHSVVCWFKRLYSSLGIAGASSHSGRRTLATRSARNLSRVGGSLKDLQDLLGHQHASTTQRYVDVSSKAKRSLIELL